MRYEDDDCYNYDYDELVENADELYTQDDEPWMDEYDDEDYLREYDSYYHNVADEIADDRFFSNGRNLVRQVISFSFLSTLESYRPFFYEYFRLQNGRLS